MRALGIGWDSPATAKYYEWFCERHPRYRQANIALATHSSIEPQNLVLDFAAGIGGTAEAVLPYLGDRGRLLCVEPSAPMRERGESRIHDPRVMWTPEIPENSTWDRILCGSAMWLMPLIEVLGDLQAYLAPRGALAFNIPSLYLGEPDEPGGGRDPLLLELPSFIEKNAVPAAGNPLPTARDIMKALRACGLMACPWTFRSRLTQEEYSDWLKIPAVNESWFPDLSPEERASRIDAAFSRCDPCSWKWERWSGWTAHRVPKCAWDVDTDAALCEGYVLLRGLIEPERVLHLRRRVLDVCLTLGWLDVSRDPCEGFARPGARAGTYDDSWIALQREAALIPEFSRMRDHPAILAALSSLFGCSVRSNCGDVCRVYAPDCPELATRPHQDDFYIRSQGDLWTVWIPLGDCPLELGGLVVLPRSHRCGIRHHAGDGGMEGILGLEAAPWITVDYRAGDVLMFHCRTIHRAHPNLSGNRLRISVDFRYQPNPEKLES